MNENRILNYIKQSFELKSQGYYKPAIEMLYKALSIDGDNVEILAQLAYLYKLLDNPQRAIYYIGKVLDIDSKHLDCLYHPSCRNIAQKINVLNNLNNFEEICGLNSCIKEFDDNILYELACAYYNNYDTAKAIEMLESALEKNSKNEKVLMFLGKINYETQKFKESEKIFSELQKINQTPEVLNYLGLFKLNEGKFSQAAEYFLKAQKADKQKAEYSYNLASAYFLNGWIDEALKYFNNAICLDPDNIDYHYSLAYLYYQKKLYDKAMFELDFIKSIEQNHTLSNILNAMIIGKKGDLLTAKSDLEKITKYNEDDDFAYFALSEIYKELFQVDLAIEILKKAIKLNPKSLSYLSSLCDMEFEQKKYEKALKLIEKMLQINEKYLYAYVLKAKIHYDLKDFDKVFETAQDIIVLDSNCTEGYYYNDLSLFNQGDKDFAIESLKKSISLDLNNALLYIKMSEFYQDLGNFKLAYEWAKEANEIDERNYQYKWLCAKLASSLHNEEEALKYYSQSYRLANFDNDLAKDYSKYLKSIGKDKQAEKLLK